MLWDQCGNTVLQGIIQFSDKELYTALAFPRGTDRQSAVANLALRFQPGNAHILTRGTLYKSNTSRRKSKTKLFFEICQGFDSKL